MPKLPIANIPMKGRKVTTTKTTKIAPTVPVQEIEEVLEVEDVTVTEEVLFIENLTTIIQEAKDADEQQVGLSVPNGVIDENWLYLKKFLDYSGPPEGRVNMQITYKDLDQELQPYLAVGTIRVYGGVYKERRQTAYFSLDNAVMRYSGRVLEPNAVVDKSIIARIFDLVNGESFRTLQLWSWNMV